MPENGSLCKNLLVAADYSFPPATNIFPADYFLPATSRPIHLLDLRESAPSLQLLYLAAKNISSSAA
jgi:hypothetical protein